MSIKKLFAAALAAGLCFVSAAAPVKAAVVTPEGATENGWANYTVADFYDSDQDLSEVKSYTYVLEYDAEISASNDFNGQVMIQNTVDWAWTQRTFSGDTSVVDWQGLPYDYELVVIDEHIAELTISCSDAAMAPLTLQDKIGIGDWNDAYTVTVKDVKFNFDDEAAAPVEEEPPTAGNGDASAEGEQPTTGGDDAPAPELPKTGLVSSMVFFAAGILISGAGVVIVKGKKEK